MLSHLAWGRYELEMVLGEGGMTSVWRALDTRLGRSVAVKMLDPTTQAAELQRLAEEARTVARLVHPNIVAVFDFGSEQGLSYLVMELVDGDSLRQRLAGGPLEISKVLEIGGQVCDALETAHRAGVVHRDIKPENILLSAADVVKICDFGVAQIPSNQIANGRAPRANGTVGTSGYMAPEQVAGAPVDARTDLYALGCVLYAMLTGAGPFAGTDPAQIAQRQARLPAPRVAASRPDVPRDLDALVAELLAKDPADRPATAAVVRDRLARITDAPSTSDASATVATPTLAGSGAPTGAGAHRATRASARATVVTRTQTMPAIDVDDQPAPSRAGIRLGPAGITAIAAGAAALTALIIVATLLGQSAQQVAAADSSSQPPTRLTPSATPIHTATGTLDAVRAAVAAQVDADRLEPGKADGLLDRLNEIETHLAEAATDKAIEKISEFRRKLAELRRDRDLSTPGYRAIVKSLDQAQLPNAADGGQDNG
jgi:hypothetical protein